MPKGITPKWLLNCLNWDFRWLNTYCSLLLWGSEKLRADKGVKRKITFTDEYVGDYSLMNWSRLVNTTSGIKETCPSVLGSLPCESWPPKNLFCQGTSSAGAGIQTLKRWKRLISSSKLTSNLLFYLWGKEVCVQRGHECYTNNEPVCRNVPQEKGGSSSLQINTLG